MPSRLHRSRRFSAVRILLVAAIVALSVAVPASPASATYVFVITGRGYGHGIGLSQWGAKGYADKGWKHDAILKHFFQGTTIRTYLSISSGTVRVNLDPSASSANSGFTRSVWTLAPADSTKYLLVNGRKLAAGQPYTFTPKGTSVLVTSVSTGSSFTVTGPADVREGGVTTSLVKVTEGTGHYRRANQRYRGRLVVTSNGASRVKLVNHLPMDSYLYGVVPGESPASWPAEALHAQAVAARSYAKTTGGEMYCTTAHQVYLGYNSEVASTNKAVMDTVGQVVYYSGVGVVKTFFFSCSGGHTANIEDVWTGATPRPYYHGMVDADVGSGSSYSSSWGSPIKYSDGALANKLRQYDAKDGVYQQTRAGTPIVTAVSISRADSGYVRSVTITWSDGVRTSATGDWFRRALGLRSTKFFISRQSNVKRTEQSDPRVAYTGRWYTAKSSVHSGGSYAYSSSSGSTASARFKGTAVALIGPRYPHFGRANVYIDGKYVRTISAYSSTAAYKQRLFSATGFSSDTTHTVSMKITATKDPASRGVTVGLDAIDVTAGDTVASP